MRLSEKIIVFIYKASEAGVWMIDHRLIYIKILCLWKVLLSATQNRTAMDVRSFLAVLCLFIGALDGSERSARRSLCHGDGVESFHDFSAKDLDGNTVSMRKFSGHVVLAVNVATF